MDLLTNRPIDLQKHTFTYKSIQKHTYNGSLTYIIHRKLSVNAYMKHTKAYICIHKPTLSSYPCEKNDLLSQNLAIKGFLSHFAYLADASQSPFCLRLSREAFCRKSLKTTVYLGLR